MNIYDYIAHNRVRTGMLLLTFPITFAITAAIGISILFHITGVDLSTQSVVCDPATMDCTYLPLWKMLSFIMLKLVPGLWLLALGWLFCSYFLGEYLIKVTTHATKVTPQSKPHLYNLVESLAMTRGLPTPSIYIINDNCLNAFATGRNPQHSSIVLTKGLIEKLERTELEAVVAHELAHIENRDTRLMLMATAGICFFTLAGELLLGVAASTTRHAVTLKLNILLMIIGATFYVYGYVVAPLVRMALSRQREYQADAMAALTTRHPLALASALRKIEGKSHVKTLKKVHSMSAMCIVNPVPTESLFDIISGIFSCHPPVRERIARLEQMAK